ncbi:MAG: ribonuclease H-like domain-containing protein [Acidobacteria bacterium]|nr:ribonuclease H-like domain-containing protein [Acidobacteriota bacterium]
MDVNFQNLRNTGTFRKRKKTGPKNPVPFKTRTYTELAPAEIPLSRNLRLLTGLSEPLEQVCFFDTETTGLSGGAGSMIFQAGIGYFEGKELIVDQFFISSPVEEPKFLFALNEILTSHPTVITYNGKSFDVPLLNTRLILNRMAESELNVIDLLHTSRAVWKHLLSSFRLTDVERGVLGIFRENDLPGAMVPGVYRDYILGRDTGAILEVLRHNHQDIVSLALLLKYLAAACKDQNNSHILVTLARKHFQNKDIDACINTASRCLHGQVPGKVRSETLWLASLALKKRGELARAAKVWAKLETRQAKIELAKYLEHRRKDYAGALAVVNRLLESPAPSRSVREALRHRKTRLQGKLR